MGDPGLSPRERQILTEIEAELRTNTGLDRRLSTMRPGRLRSAFQALCRVPVSVLVLLAACSLGLLSVGVQLRSTAALTVFALIWAATAVLLLARGIHGLIERRRSARGR
ncbi:DUF3040 domain-containing protein [Kitasatospora sp. HPMI-4]|uniref:DUF3040 domain-containing protein n=1 Tax=Kitasatospora sp. HPMI-4 TaxID=3448443 RepID=UPI003F1B2CE4